MTYSPEGIPITCQNCSTQWIGYTRDYCPGCGLDENNRPAPPGGRK
jgi:hypothetical protein